MNNESQVLKKIEIQRCPHCSKEVCVSLNIVIPSITCVSSLDDIKKAKKEIKERLEEIKFVSEEEKKLIINQLDDEGNLLDSSDVDSIVKQISLDQTNKISQSKQK